MSVLSDLRKKLTRSRKYRESFAASIVKRMLPLQIRVLRKQRGWSQETLAERSNVTQGVISRAEDPDYGNLTVNTLVRVAGGFDCAFVGRFVPFSELGRWYVNLQDEAALDVPSFEEDAGFSDADVSNIFQATHPTSGGNTLLPAYEPAPMQDQRRAIQGVLIGTPDVVCPECRVLRMPPAKSTSLLPPPEPGTGFSLFGAH